MESIYEKVTQSIVDALEKGVAPWVRPWAVVGDGVPTNLTTRRRYKGINFLTLSLHSAIRGYTRSIFLTYRQAAALGAQVKRGERGVPVIYWQLRRVAACAETQPWPDEAQLNERVVPLCRCYTVFHISQVEHLPPHLLPAPRSVAWLADAAAEDLLIRSQADIRYGGDHAYYRPDADFIQLPERGAFADSASFYGTALHELVHWTGHRGRLNRDFSSRFGREDRAVEELVAEIGSAYLCASLGLNGKLQHENYVASWLKVLRSDEHAIFTASARAQAAAEFLLPSADPLTADAVKEAA